MTGRIGSIVPAILVAHLAAAGIASMTVAPAHAEDCLAAPNSPSAKGNHWFYRLDRATKRKCWYQRAQETGDQRSQEASVQPVRRPAPPAARPALSQILQMASPAPANDAAPMAFAQSAWPETTASGRREAGAFAVPRREPTSSTQTVDRQDLGLSVATKPVALASNEVAAPFEQPQVQPNPVAPAAAAPVAAAVPDHETFTPFRMVLLAIGILFVPGVVLRLIFKFGASTRQRIYAHRQDKKWSDNLVPRWASAKYNAAEVPPLEPMKPLNQVIDAEQLLRKILRELDRSTSMPMPDALSSGSRR
jgi:hypothetical protein